MNNKIIIGIVLIIIGILLYFLPLWPIPNIQSCYRIAIPATIDLGCAIINSIPALILIIIGAFLIYKNK